MPSEYAMRHRPGVTLIEVLMAIFVMGIGMLALLVLFPLGALSVAQALRDDRAAQAAGIANSWANAVDVRHDAQVVGITDPTSGVQTLRNAFVDPFPGSVPALVPPYAGPSFPVYVDPYYFNLGQKTIGNLSLGPTTVTPGFARRSLSLSGQQ